MLVNSMTPEQRLVAAVAKTKLPLEGSQVEGFNELSELVSSKNAFASNFPLEVAQHELANCYLKGIGTPKNIKLGVFWLRQAYFTILIPPDRIYTGQSCGPNHQSSAKRTDALKIAKRDSAKRLLQNQAARPVLSLSEKYKLQIKLAEIKLEEEVSQKQTLANQAIIDTAIMSSLREIAQTPDADPNDVFVARFTIYEGQKFGRATIFSEAELEQKMCANGQQQEFFAQLKTAQLQQITGMVDKEKIEDFDKQFIQYITDEKQGSTLIHLFGRITVGCIDKKVQERRIAILKKFAAMKQEYGFVYGYIAQAYLYAKYEDEQTKVKEGGPSHHSVVAGISEREVSEEVREQRYQTLLQTAISADKKIKEQKQAEGFFFLQKAALYRGAELVPEVVSFMMSESRKDFHALFFWLEQDFHHSSLKDKEIKYRRIMAVAQFLKNTHNMEGYCLGLITLLMLFQSDKNNELFPQQVKEAAKKVHIASLKQNAPPAIRAYFNGLAVFYGWEVREDLAAAIGFYKEAAEQGIKQAHLQLAMCYQKRSDVTSQIKALHALHESAIRFDKDEKDRFLGRQKTVADGNCVFHAAFGSLNESGQYEAKNANEMRRAFYDYLSCFRSPAEMPLEVRDKIHIVLRYFYDGTMTQYGYKPSATSQVLIESINTANAQNDRKVNELKEIFFARIFNHILENDEAGKLFILEILHVLLNARVASSRYNIGQLVRKKLNLPAVGLIDYEKILQLINQPSAAVIIGAFFNDAGNLTLIKSIISENLIGYYIELLPAEEEDEKAATSPKEELITLTRQSFEKMIAGLFNNPDFYQDYLAFIKKEGSNYYLWVEELFVMSQISGRTTHIHVRDDKQGAVERTVFRPDPANLPPLWDRSKYLLLFGDKRETHVYHNGMDHYEAFIAPATLQERVKESPALTQPSCLLFSRMALMRLEAIRLPETDANYLSLKEALAHCYAQQAQALPVYEQHLKEEFLCRAVENYDAVFAKVNHDKPQTDEKNDNSEVMQLRTKTILQYLSCIVEKQPQRVIELLGSSYADIIKDEAAEVCVDFHLLLGKAHWYKTFNTKNNEQRWDYFPAILPCYEQAITLAAKRPTLSASIRAIQGLLDLYDNPAHQGLSLTFDSNRNDGKPVSRIKLADILRKFYLDFIQCKAKYANKSEFFATFTHEELKMLIGFPELIMDKYRNLMSIFSPDERVQIALLDEAANQVKDLASQELIRRVNPAKKSHIADPSGRLLGDFLTAMFEQDGWVSVPQEPLNQQNNAAAPQGPGVSPQKNRQG